MVDSDPAGMFDNLHWIWIQADIHHHSMIHPVLSIDCMYLNQ